MLGNTKGKQLFNYVPDYVLFDLETTGISCVKDDIIEISAVKVRNGKIVGEFSELVNPLRPIPMAASSVNNITDSMVAGAPTLDKVLPRFIDFVGDDILVGHNILAFDMKFIYRECDKFYGKALTNDFVDTLKIAKLVFPEWHHRRLEDLAEYYRISTAGAHRALNDCRMNQRVFENLGKELAGTGEPGGKIGEKPVVKLCEICGQPMMRRNGKFGAFWGCSGYPKCRYTENIS